MTQAPTVEQLYAECRQLGIDEARRWKIFNRQPMPEYRIKQQVERFAFSLAFAFRGMGLAVRVPIDTDPDIMDCLSKIEAAFREELAGETPPEFLLAGAPGSAQFKSRRTPSLERLKEQAADVGDAIGRILFTTTAGCATDADFAKEKADFTIFFPDDEVLAADNSDRSQIQLLKLIYSSAVHSGYAELAEKEHR